MITAKGANNGYLTEISNMEASISVDVPKSKGERGGNFNPHDLLCAAYASCLNITVRMVLADMQLVYDEVVTNVDLDRSDPNQTKFLYEVKIIGDLSEEDKNKAITKATRCPVRKTLSKEINFQPLPVHSAPDPLP